MESPQRPTLLSLWDLMALLAFGALWLFYQELLPSLPAMVPTHFDALGHANGWTPKASLPWVIFGIPLLIWAITTLTGIFMASRQEDPAKARAIAMQPLRGLLGVGLALTMGASLLAPTHGPTVVFLGLGGLLALLVLGIILMVKAFGHVEIDPAERALYRWGIFYVNPADQRIFVPKRIGVGWTLNFGRPASFLVMILLLLPVLLAVALSKGSH
jgi:uncharacterized membrane protein